MNGFDLIIMALIAVFVALRLRAELGNKSGGEPQPPAAGQYITPSHDRSAQDPMDDDANVVVDLSDDPALREGYGQIRKADPTFDPAVFLQGAEAVYPMVLEAFWEGDKATLENLVSEDVFAGFEGAIDTRANLGQRQEGKVVALHSAKATHARQHGAMAEVTVEYKADISSATYDEHDRLVAGNETDANSVTDIWTFAHNSRSDDPSWVLVATRTE